MEDKSGQPEKPKARSIPIAGINIDDDKQHHIKVGKTEPGQKTLADYVPPSMEDPQLDKVIDDIIVSESNEILAAEDSIYDSNTLPAKKPKKRGKLAKAFRSKWLYIGLAVVIIGIFVLPFTRYAILGQFIKSDYKITVVDSDTGKPVSDTIIKVDSRSYSTNASGQATLKLKLGKYSYSLSKQYYAKDSGSIFVGFSKKQSRLIKLDATGRRVEITVINKISGRPLSGVKISILDTNAITNSSGQTQIVLPTKDSSYQAVVTANSFNTLAAPIKVTTSKTANVVSMVPNGYIYYLSKATGTINVIKANLDGSNPVIELAGTGKETASTVLLPSPDWKYLALEAQRNGNQPELYVINTSTGTLNEFDSAADSFNLIGWSGDDFIYDEIASSSDPSTVGREQIKSYNATNGQLNIIDENQALGSDPSYAYQSFSNFQLLPNLLVYTTSWNSVASYDISNQNNTIRGVEPNGLNKKDYSTFSTTSTGVMGIVKFEPQSLYISISNTSTNQIDYYSFANGAVNPANITAAIYSQSYPTYYLSPSGVNTLWTASDNNQPEIFVGNQTGQNGKKLIVPTGYSSIGWYDNIYVLLSKNGQLYIAPLTGTNTPTLIGSYFSSS